MLDDRSTDHYLHLLDPPQLLQQINLFKHFVLVKLSSSQHLVQHLPLPLTITDVLLTESEAATHHVDQVLLQLLPAVVAAAALVTPEHSAGPAHVLLRLGGRDQLAAVPAHQTEPVPADPGELVVAGVVATRDTVNTLQVSLQVSSFLEQLQTELTQETSAEKYLTLFINNILIIFTCEQSSCARTTQTDHKQTCTQRTQT